MKRTLILFFISLTFITFSKAQKFSVGPKFGVNLSRFIHDSDTLYDPLANDSIYTTYIKSSNDAFLPCFNAGIAFSVQSKRNFTLYGELIYNQKGYRKVRKLEFEDYKFNIDDRIVFNYIDFPVMGRWLFGKQNVKGYFNIGPHLGFWLNSRYRGLSQTKGDVSRAREKVKFLDYDEIDSAEARGDIYFVKKNVFRVEFGINAGAGVLIDAGPGKIMVDARYSIGISNIFDYVHRRTGEFLTYKNSGMSFSVGYLIPLEPRIIGLKP